jgi:stage III sporulation protein AG
MHMVETLRKLAMENKILVLTLLAFVGIGAVFMLAGRFAQEPDEYIRKLLYPEDETVLVFSQSEPAENFSYEEALERRLEEFFSMVEGAGAVRVMISPLGPRETVFAVDVNESRSQTTEQDAQGGSRETRQYQNNAQTVIITDRQGVSTPLVLREIEPRTEGIVIIAEGGDNPLVRDALTRAARAVLGLEAHMVQVLTKKT